MFPVLLFAGCSKDMNEPDVDISAVTGVFTAFSYSLEGRNSTFCKDREDLYVRFDQECIRATDGFEYCQMGEMLIRQDETVSSTLKIYGGGLSYFPVGEGSISISQAVADICVDGECKEYDIEGNSLFYRYRTTLGCYATIRLQKM